MSAKKRFSLDRPSRREFVQAGIGMSAAGLAALGAVDRLAAQEKSANASAAGKVTVEAGATILFQGDSITDAGRKRDATDANSPEGLGRGYAWLAAARMLVAQSGKRLKIYNRGISGNKVYQLAERWQKDCIDLKPDVVSILIGVNDFWHTLDGTYKGTVEKYEADYRALLKRTKEALPKVKIIVCEPFVLKAGKVNDKWSPVFDEYRDAARKIADEMADAFVAFQYMFDKATKIAPASLWAADGVHPTSDGAALMADWWRKSVTFD